MIDALIFAYLTDDYFFYLFIFRKVQRKEILLDIYL